MRHFRIGVLAVVGVLLSFGKAWSQTDTGGIDVPITTMADNLREEIPSYVLADMVYQSVALSIEPSANPTTAYILANDLSYSWLPDIANVTFVIVPETDRTSLRENGVRDYYYFPCVTQTRWKFTIELGRVNRCQCSGSLYTFRWRRGRLTRDTQVHSGFGYAIYHCDPEAP